MEGNAKKRYNGFFSFHFFINFFSSFLRAATASRRCARASSSASPGSRSRPKAPGTGPCHMLLLMMLLRRRARSCRCCRSRSLRRGGSRLRRPSPRARRGRRPDGTAPPCSSPSSDCSSGTISPGREPNRFWRRARDSPGGRAPMSTGFSPCSERAGTCNRCR